MDEKVRENENLVRWVLGRFFPGWEHDEDLHQIGLIALWRACETYDPEQGVKFSTYATKCIRAAILTEFRRQSAQHVPDVALSLDEPCRAYEGEATYGEVLKGKEFEYCDVEGYFDRLGKLKNKKVKPAVILRAYGMELREIAAAFNISHQRVYQLMQMARREWEKCI